MDFKTDYLMIDTNNLIKTCFYVKEYRENYGLSGLYGVVQALELAIREFYPRKILFAWSKGDPVERRRLCPNYKTKSASKPLLEIEQLEDQKTLLRNLLSHIPVRQIVVEGVESRDVIGFLCEKLPSSNKVLVTAGMSLSPLLGPKTSIFNPLNGSFITKDLASEFLGFPVDHYLLWKCLVGDSSMNIDGVKGIGKQKATTIINSVIAGGKKFPLNREEQAVLDRNKYLFAPAALLSAQQKTEIINCCVREWGKEVGLDQFQQSLESCGLKERLQNTCDWADYVNRTR